MCISPPGNFNPRSREGSDYDDYALMCGVDISIHAPAKGATDSPGYDAGRKGHFNPRSREGSDVCDKLYQLDLAEFQSTLPRRERPSNRRRMGRTKYFNPRSREGSDYFSVEAQKYPDISIHAPAKGATYNMAAQTNILQFQSTLPRRERRRKRRRFSRAGTFQSTLPRRERRSNCI